MLFAPLSSPSHSLPARALLGLLRAYRLLLSPWLGSACRFEPTCSRYAIEAVERHGAAHGGYLALRRLSRCHPWCEGGCDPVPMPPFRLFPAPDEQAGLPSASRKISS